MSVLRAAGPAPRRPLGHSFWRLFASTSLSNLSDGVLVVALPLLAASLTRDPVAVSGMAALAFLPWLLFAVPAGVLVDRVDRRAAMTGANVFRALLVGALAGLVVTGQATLPVLYVVAFLLGAAETVYDSAARAMLPAVVPRSRLERGNSLLQTSESVGNIFLGAPVGAWLFALAVSAPLWLNSAAWLLAAALALTIAGRFAPAPGEPTRVRDDLVEGLVWLRDHELLRALMVTTGLSAVAFSLTSGILVLFALEDMGLSEQQYGLMLAAAGVAAVLGAMSSPYVTRLLGRTAAMGVSNVVAGLCVAAMAVWPHPVAASVAFALSAGAVSTFNVQIMSVRQALIPARLFGRVQGAYRTVIWGGIPVGTVVGGALGKWFGLPVVFAVSGLAVALLGLAVTWVLYAGRHQIAEAFVDDADDRALV